MKGLGLESQAENAQETNEFLQAFVLLGSATLINRRHADREV